MARIITRKPDDKLPHARLYVDDLMEIEEIFRTEAKCLSGSPAVTFRYALDDDVSFTECQDLIAHSGFSAIFTMEVSVDSGYFKPVLRFRKSSHPTVDFPYQLSEMGWALTGKIHSIFYDRRDRLKGLVQSWSSPFISGAALAVLVWLGIWNLISAIVFVEGRHLTVGFRSLWATLPGMLVLLLLSYAEARHNGIYLRMSRQDKLERAKLWQERRGKLGWAILTATIGGIITLLAARITGHVK